MGHVYLTCAFTYYLSSVEPAIEGIGMIYDVFGHPISDVDIKASTVVSSNGKCIMENGMQNHINR